MAWKAECSRRKWHCVVSFDAITWYKEKLHIDWWDSLTDEEKEEYNKQVDELRHKRIEEGKLSLLQFTHFMTGLGYLRQELDLKTDYEEMMHELFYN